MFVAQQCTIFDNRHTTLYATAHAHNFHFRSCFLSPVFVRLYCRCSRSLLSWLFWLRKSSNAYTVFSLRSTWFARFLSLSFIRWRCHSFKLLLCLCVCVCKFVCAAMLFSIFLLLFRHRCVSSSNRGRITAENEEKRKNETKNAPSTFR